MSLVLDASVALEWLLRDSTDEGQAYAADILHRVEIDGALVPPLWHYEVTNVSIQAQRRNRVQQNQVEQFLDQKIHQLPINTDTRRLLMVTPAIRKLAAAHGLSAYDAAYLELAQSHDIPLATLDDELRLAATELGIPLA